METKFNAELSAIRAKEVALIRFIRENHHIWEKFKRFTVTLQNKIQKEIHNSLSPYAYVF